MPHLSSSAPPAAPPKAGRVLSSATPIMTSPHPTDLDYRPSYLAAGIASALVFILYLVTLAPNTAMWDTSEYITAAYILGIPHPPGNPFFVLIGRVFTILPIAPHIGTRVNVLAALCSAIAAGTWFLIVERVLVSWFPLRWQRIMGASLAALIGATAFTVWSQSVVNEKVYTVSLAFFAIVAWLTVVWSDDPDHPKANRILILIAFLLGLGYANHPAGFLPLPAVGAAVLLRKPRVLLDWKLWIYGLLALGLGMTPFATQPIIAAHNPAINEGEPTACRDGLKLDCTFDKQTWVAFKYNFDRGQYAKPPLSVRQAPFSAQLGMWWLYFKWQWLRDAHDESPVAQTVLAVVFLVLGLFGGYVHWRRDRRSFMFFGPLMFTLTIALVYYMNFKYGYSQAPELGDAVDREVRDRDYFYLWSYSAWSVWASLGLIFLWESVAALVGAERVKLGRETVEVPRRTSWLVTSPVLLLALVPLFGNWKVSSRAGQTDTRDFAHDLLQSVEPYGILVTVGDNDTFPLWYAQEVEGIRKDVIVANTSLLNTDWYTRQIIRRPVFEYDAAKGPAVYRNVQWKKPSGPPLNMTLEQADSVPLAIDIRQTQVFTKPGTDIVAQITPRTLTRADLFVLYMIRDAYPDRPIYFSRTSGSYAHELGLGSFVLTQGLARKLMPRVPTAGKDTLQIPGEGWVDLGRTKALWDNVFEAPQSIVKRGDWVDKPSVGIPYLYVTTGLILSSGLEMTGQSQAARTTYDKAKLVAQATHLDDLFRQIPGPAQLLAPESGGDVPQTQQAPATPAPSAPAQPAGPRRQ